VSSATPAEMQRLLAEEFERRGWQYDLSVGRGIAERAERDGEIDGTKLAGTVSTTWLAKNGVRRGELAAAIGTALTGRTPTSDQPTPTVLNVYGDTYSLHMESGAQITGGQVNVGGTQINIQAGGDRADVLAGVGALIRAGLDGNWNSDAAGALAAAIDARDDIGFEDVEGVVVEVAEAGSEPPDKGRIRGMLRSITEQGLGGALGTGISAGLGWLLRNPPI
jgi:hypothetical protein